MKHRFKKYFAVFSIVIMAVFTVGCNPISSLEKKMGWRNDYFEDIKNGSIDTISIQSTRDMRFKFSVTVDSAKNEMYNYLSRGKVSENKSDLDPDYIFEFKSGDEVKKFYYVVGAKEGNFYSDDLTLSVSNRLDEGIMKNLSFIRKPRDFDYIYYKAITEVLSQIKGNVDLSQLKVGINIQGDVECLKYVFSTDIEKFLEDAKKIAPQIAMVKNNQADFDLVLDIKNRGYDSTNYKSHFTVTNKTDNSIDNYYVTAVNTYKQWQVKVSNVNDKPKDW